MTDEISAALTQKEQEKVLSRLAALLAAQAKKYLAGDGSSLPVETAQELWRSLLYTLHFALAEDGLPERALLTAELPDLLLRGQSALREQLERTRVLWSRVCLTAPPVENFFYKDTLTELGRFFRRYDLRYFAHRVPCSIDYPLCVPVSEKLQGVSYVDAWLHRLLLENWFLSRFRVETVEALLARGCRDYRNMPLNLCEQPLVNAIGLAALGKPVFSLSLTAGDRVQLMKRRLDTAALENAAQGVLSQFVFVPPGAEAYIGSVARMLCPRLDSAATADALSAVFL